MGEVFERGNWYNYMDGLRLEQLRIVNQPYHDDVGVRYVAGGDTPYFEWNMIHAGGGFSPRLEDAGQLIINQVKLHGEADIVVNRKGPTNLRLLMTPQQCEGLIQLSEYGLPLDSSAILYRVENYIDPSQRESNVAKRLEAFTPNVIPPVGSLRFEVIVQREVA